MPRVVRIVVAAALALPFPRIAAAHDEPAPAREGAPAEEKKEAKEEEAPWEVTVDFAAGGTTTEILTAGRPGRLEQPPANVFDSTRVTAYTVLFGLERHLGERVTVGARIPFIYANLSSRTGFTEDRSASVAGNLELEGAFVIARGETWSVSATLEVALPTAGGKEPPTRDEVAAEREKRFDYTRYDSFAAAHAGAAVRGAYESALFEPGNLGLVPKLSAKFRFDKLTLSPMVKLENLIDVTSGDDEIYINELVAGVRASYRVAPAVEPGVHLWARELHEHTHADDSSSGVAVVEPFVRFHAGPFEPMVSFILPFTGDLADDKAFGVRASISAEF